MNKFHTMNSHPMIIFHPMSVLDILHMMDAHHNDLQPMMVDIHPMTDKHHMKASHPRQRILSNSVISFMMKTHHMMTFHHH